MQLIAFIILSILVLFILLLLFSDKVENHRKGNDMSILDKEVIKRIRGGK